MSWHKASDLNFDMRFLGKGRQKDNTATPSGSQGPLRDGGKVLDTFLSASHLNILSLCWLRTSRQVPMSFYLLLVHCGQVCYSVDLASRLDISWITVAPILIKRLNLKHSYQLPLLPTIRLTAVSNNVLASWMTPIHRALWPDLGYWSWLSFPLQPLDLTQFDGLWSFVLLDMIDWPKGEHLRNTRPIRVLSQNLSNGNNNKRKLVLFGRWHHTEEMLSCGSCPQNPDKRSKHRTADKRWKEGLLGWLSG